jgi:hypothetical protein
MNYMLYQNCASMIYHEKWAKVVKNKLIVSILNMSLNMSLKYSRIFRSHSVNYLENKNSQICSFLMCIKPHLYPYTCVWPFWSISCGVRIIFFSFIDPQKVGDTYIDVATRRMNPQRYTKVAKPKLDNNM